MCPRLRRRCQKQQDDSVNWTNITSSYQNSGFGMDWASSGYCFIRSWRFATSSLHDGNNTHKHNTMITTHTNYLQLAEYSHQVPQCNHINNTQTDHFNHNYFADKPLLFPSFSFSTCAKPVCPLKPLKSPKQLRLFSPSRLLQDSAICRRPRSWPSSRQWTVYEAPCGQNGRHLSLPSPTPPSDSTTCRPGGHDSAGARNGDL